MTCGDAVEPPIGIEPMTYSLRESYIREMQSAGWHLPHQPRQSSWVRMTVSRSCMPKMRSRQNPLVVSTGAIKGGCRQAGTC
jgi:hypothetical protein